MYEPHKKGWSTLLLRMSKKVILKDVIIDIFKASIIYLIFFYQDWCHVYLGRNDV